jgi:hypothetical protein
MIKFFKHLPKTLWNNTRNNLNGHLRCTAYYMGFTI